MSNSNNLNSHKLEGSNYGFSAIGIGDLEAVEFTIAQILFDNSGSVHSFARDMEHAGKEIVKSLQKSPRADNLLVRSLAFGTTLDEIHGLIQLNTCDTDSYDNALSADGRTCLYDGVLNAVESSNNYAKRLVDADMFCNGIIIIITDGCDWGSTASVQRVRSAIEETKTAEMLESLQIVLVGVNVQNKQVSKKLQDFKDSAGIDQYIEMPDVSKSTMAKLVGFVSQSVSSSSQALGTGGPSQPITI